MDQVEEIKTMARSMMLEVPVPEHMMAQMLPTSMSTAKEMFLNIFVNSALDQVSNLLEKDKIFIATAAANAVDAAVAAIARAKTAIGLPATPTA